MRRERQEPPRISLGPSSRKQQPQRRGRRTGLSTLLCGLATIALGSLALLSRSVLHISETPERHSVPQTAPPPVDVDALEQAMQHAINEPNSAQGRSTDGRSAAATIDSFQPEVVPRRARARKRGSGARVGYVMASFKNGALNRNGRGNGLGDGLRLLTSLDARSWVPLPGEPLVLRTEVTGGRVFRDPSFVLVGGVFHLVFTSDLCVGQKPRFWKCEQLPLKRRPLPRFGYATSRDLVTWESVRLVEVPLHAACSIWAPEIAVLPADEGGGFMVLFSATQVPRGNCPANFKSTLHRSWCAHARPVVGSSPLARAPTLAVGGSRSHSIRSQRDPPFARGV